MVQKKDMEWDKETISLSFAGENILIKGRFFIFPPKKSLKLASCSAHSVHIIFTQKLHSSIREPFTLTETETDKKSLDSKCVEVFTLHRDTDSVG